MLKLGHKKLNTWNKSLDLVSAVYHFCDKLPDKEKFIIIPQLKRAAISVSSNIAEGYARISKKEIFRYCKIIVGRNRYSSNHLYQITICEGRRNRSFVRFNKSYIRNVIKIDEFTKIILNV